MLAFLSKIVQQNTWHFQEDIQYDRETLSKAAQEPNMEDRVFYWMSRPNGTWCVKEREVFLRGSGAHSIWTHYAKEPKGIKAYRITITGMEDGKVMGAVYPLNYEKQVLRVQQAALSIAAVTLLYGNGGRVTVPYHEYHKNDDIQKVRYEPESEAELTRILIQEHRLQSGRRRTRKAPEHPDR